MKPHFNGWATSFDTVAPDDSGSWVGGGIGLAHRRLSIIDLSPAGRQPLTNEDRSIFTIFNGEIYNFRELRAQLVAKGHRFRSQTDSEVIVHLYEEEGERCVERLHGMFAFAVWDDRRRRLMLARDRVGKKPLKYALIDDGIVFASELKAILASGTVEPDVDHRAVHQYLSMGYVPAPRTGLRGIVKLPPAHTLVWEPHRTVGRRYWSLNFRNKKAQDHNQWMEDIRSTVRAAVRRRLVSDVPLGAFLSGGVDSSIVVACMSEATDRPVETFSIGFEHEQFNELPFARLVAKRYATNHHEFVVGADDTELLPELARIYEEPYSDPSALPSYFLARETRRHVTVALNGDGGDEGFRRILEVSSLLEYQQPAFRCEKYRVEPGRGRRLQARRRRLGGLASAVGGPGPDGRARIGTSVPLVCSDVLAQ